MKISNYLVALTLGSVIAFTSCDENDDSFDELSSKETTLQQANIQFVEKTVIPVYSSLADETMLLLTSLEELQENKNNANVSNACELWKKSRQYWEWSEAFLFGAASKYYIDPHIDTWPLDKTALENLLSNESMMNDIENVVANLNNGLVGFHGLEYIIFREGQPRPSSDITSKELSYAIAVAKDLFLSSCRLEAAWAGMEKIADYKAEVIEDAELEPEDNFGEQMRLCGYPGSVWKSVTSGSEQIIEGCRTIVDEVGNSKIGKPYTGEDISYIESPHAYNSIQDFEDNIRSVQFVYYGAFGATSPQKGSLSAYVKSVNSTLDHNLIDAIDECVAKIQAMPKPFVLNYKDSKVRDAINACADLDDALAAVQQLIVRE